MRDFLKIMKQINRYEVNSWNRSNFIYTFKNGSVIEFMNSDIDKATGSRRNVLYINEANKGVEFDVYDQLELRTSDDIYIDFNPNNIFWPHTEVLTSDDSELLILTFEDNVNVLDGESALPNNIIENLLSKLKKVDKSEFWRNWCDVYIWGKVGKLEGSVFSNWSLIDERPDDIELIAYGLDFGWDPDPTALTAVYRNNENGKIFIEELLYKTKLDTNQIYDVLKYLDTSVVIWGDRDNRIISELRAMGINIQKTEKPPNSVNQGIFLIQGYELEVLYNNENLIEELEKYIWKEKKSGVPIDAFNHLIDSFRYVFWMSLGNRYNKEYDGVNL